MWKKWFSKSDSRKEDSSPYHELNQARIPKHIAIIMDGNGRWAQKKGLPRTLGHRAGAEAFRNIVKTSSEIGVHVLTAYAFSTENWKRPRDEVDLLMKLLSDYLDSEIDELHSNRVQIRFIGNVGELAESLQKKIEQAQSHTKQNDGLILNLAVNYGGRAEIVRAVQNIAQQALTEQIKPEDISQQMISNQLYTAGLPDPDLLIRPSGDSRISNFLLWQMAYTEIWLTDTYWPDFTSSHLLEAIRDYQKRERRFGGLKNHPIS